MKKGEKTPEEVKEKNRQTHLKNMTQERKDRISASETGKVVSEESKAKMSESAKKRTPEQNKARLENVHLSRKIHTAVEGTMLDYLRESLTRVDENTGHKYYEDFIDSFLRDAKENPNSQCARMLGGGLFNENVLTKLDAQVNKMMQKDIEFHTYRLRTTLFDKQRELFDDNEDREIITICGRRAGKTECVARKITAAALTPDTPILYVNLTFSNAIAQMFDLVLECLDKVDLQLKRASKAEGFIELANGSVIRFRGNANNEECKKILGFKYRKVFVDEVQDQRNLKFMMNDVIGPLTADYADSQIIYTGTPPRVPHTYCEKLWNLPNIKKFYWTMLDNPYMPNPKAFIEKKCKDRGVDESDSVIQREYYGRWVYDKEAQVFKSRTYFTDLPTNIRFEKAYIGVDYGDRDYNAVCLGLKAGNKLYIAEENKFNRGTVTDLINAVIEMRKKAAKFISEERNIMIICDVNKKDISREMALTYGMKYVYDAYKVDKQVAIAQLADFMRLQNIQIKAGGAFDDECEQILYKRDEDTDAILTELDDVFHPDMMDAVLYISRQWIVDTPGLKLTQDVVNKEAKLSTRDYKPQQTIVRF